MRGGDVLFRSCALEHVSVGKGSASVVRVKGEKETEKQGLTVVTESVGGLREF